MGGFATQTGEGKIKRFLQTLTEQEKIELIEEVRRMIEFKALDLDKKDDEKPSVDFTFMEAY